jgi:hypothetical protein
VSRVNAIGTGDDGRRFPADRKPESHSDSCSCFQTDAGTGGVRDKPEGDYAVYNVTLTVSKSTLPSYLLAVPLAELVAQHPNGFQLMLKDPSAQTTLMTSDTLGSGKHLAALVACAN